MTSLAAFQRQSPAHAGFARSRLYLGISGVGTAVLGATVLLTTGIAGRFLSTSHQQPLLLALSSLGAVFLVIMFELLLFDLVGGALLVRQKGHIGPWMRRWLRGASVQWCVWMGCTAVLMVVSRLSGTAAVAATIGTFVVLQLLLAALRGVFARLVSSMPIALLSHALRGAAEQARLDPEAILVLETADEAFVGGFGGIRAGTTYMPSRFATLSPAALVAACVRRRVLAESGAHTRGVLGAVAWNALGMLLVLVLTGASFSSSAGTLIMMAGMTLWAFASVLILPTISRAAVFALDGQVASEVGAPAVRASIEELDRWQDDEPRRSRLVETIFHPVSARSARSAQLSSNTTNRVRIWHAHHIARHALWLSWATMSPIARLVHCNVGRPALWVMLPGD
jgi:hypothetical protein